MTREYLPSPVMELDLNGSVVYINPTGKHLFPNLQKTGLNHPYLTDIAKIADTLKEEGETSCEREIKAGDHWYRQVFYLLKAENRLRVFGFDITERKQMEEALRRSEARLRSVFRALTEGIVFLNTEGMIEETNDAVERIVGYSSEALTDPARDPRSRIIRSDGTPFPVDEQPAFVVLRTSKAVRNIEMGVPKPDGSLTWLSVSSEPVRDDQGNLLGVVSSLFDITERRQMEEALRRSASLLNYSQKISKIGGWEYDVATKRITWTDEVYRLYEVSPDFDPNNLEQNLSFYDAEHIPNLKRAFERAVAYGEPYDLELPFVTAKGHHIWVRAIGHAKKLDGNVGRVYGTIMDITDSKHMERQRDNLIADLKDALTRVKQVIDMLPL